MAMSLFSRFFRSIYRFSTKIGRFLTKITQKWPHRLSEKLANLSAKLADLSVFPIFTVSPSSPVHFGRFFLIFADFYRIFQKSTGSVTSSFRSSAEFSNTTVNSVIVDSDHLLAAQT
jgi:hypothetical protein